MLGGDGTNLKMFSFLYSGLPVVSTEIGARGISGFDNIFICNIFDFDKEIIRIFNLINKDKLKLPNIPLDYHWSNIARIIDEEFETFLKI
jgi:hypothetical protein